MRLPFASPLALLAGCAGATPDGPASAPSGPASAPAHDHGRHMSHRFDDAARWAEALEPPDRDGWQRPTEVVALLELRPGLSVADIGAGTGYFVPHLSAAVGAEGRVLALDVEPNMIDHVRQRAARAGLDNVEPRVIPPDDPGLTAGSVDRILIVNTWHHIPGRGPYAARLRDALRPGGLLVIVDFTLDAPMGPSTDHRIAPEAVAATLSAAGLEAEISEEALPHQYVVRARRPS